MCLPAPGPVVPSNTKGAALAKVPNASRVKRTFVMGREGHEVEVGGYVNLIVKTAENLFESPILGGTGHRLVPAGHQPVRSSGGKLPPKTGSPFHPLFKHTLRPASRPPNRASNRSGAARRDVNLFTEQQSARSIVPHHASRVPRFPSARRKKNECRTSSDDCGLISLDLRPARFLERSDPGNPLG